MHLSQAATTLLLCSIAQTKADGLRQLGSKSSKSSKGSKNSKSQVCPLERIPINNADFGEPDWETIIEIAFPTWATPENGCPRLNVIGGELVHRNFPMFEEGKWNPCYYTKGFAGLNPEREGYPTPLDTHYPYEFAAPFLGQPGDGSVHHCNASTNTINIAECPKLGNTCGKDCATITDDYGIGHIPPFVPLAAIKNAYGKCGTSDICADWFHYPTSGCNIKKSVLDELVYDQFGEDNTIKYEPPILIEGEPSSTYYRLEYGGEEPACTDGVCRGPHYCSKDVASGEDNIWGDFCPYVHTGENSGKYRHPHIALASLEQWIANQCMPDKCASEWLDSPNGANYGADALNATSITWAVMDNSNGPMSQPKVPYEWPISGISLFPGIDTLYPEGSCARPAPGVYVTQFAAQGPECGDSTAD
mmetsp:Transcript_20050/g.43471  ORF Transcript_20050/g.43471 Transcript_20050/m.43471 type:complete len:419 (+) Transcript_20050:20-1276(+)